MAMAAESTQVNWELEKPEWTEWKNKKSDEWSQWMDKNGEWKKKTAEDWAEWKEMKSGDMSDWMDKKGEMDGMKHHGEHHGEHHGKRHGKHHGRGIVHHVKKWAHHAKRWMKHHFNKHFDEERHDDWWGRDEREEEQDNEMADYEIKEDKPHKRTIWLDVQDDDEEIDSEAQFYQEEDDELSFSPFKHLKQRLHSWVEDHHDMIAFAVNGFLTYKKWHAEVEMAAWLGASNFISYNHHSLCKNAPDASEDDS